MKANLTFLFASLLTLATAAHAADTETQLDSPLVLPKYVVSAPRATAAEQRINASLEAFQQQANSVTLLTALDPVLPQVIATTRLTAAVIAPSRTGDSKS